MRPRGKVRVRNERHLDDVARAIKGVALLHYHSFV